jgi:MoxR-like ATPase
VQFLILGAKAKAALSGRAQADTSDIQVCAQPVLRHRIVVNFAAESDGITSDKVIDELIKQTPTAQDELLSDARFKKLFAS